MIYLCEREIGYDPQAIGFPSIDGCRAVVVLTAAGMFGFHLNGTLSTAKKNKFVQFISRHQRGGAGTAIYAASKDARNRYYEQELRDIAQGVGYGGDIYWADLSSVDGRSAYVEMRLVPGNNTCIITARGWDDDVDSDDGNKGDYVDSGSRTIANGPPPARMYSAVDPSGLRSFYPTRI